MPHGLASIGSVIIARPGTLETRFVCAYWATAGAGTASAASESAAVMPTEQEREKWQDAEFAFKVSLQTGSSDRDVAEPAIEPRSLGRCHPA